MPQEGLQTQTGAPTASTPSNASQTPTVETTSQPAPAPADNDPWSEAEAAYNQQFGDMDGDDVTNPVLDLDKLEKEQGSAEGPDGEKEQPAKASDEDPEGSTKEDPEGALNSSDAENYWSTEGLDTPEKVAERLKKIQGMFTKKNQESKSQIEQVTQSNLLMAELIGKVAADPSPDTLKPILQQYGKQLEEAGYAVNWDKLNSLSGAAGKDSKEPEKKESPEDIQAKEQEFIKNASSYLLESKNDEDFASRVGTIVFHAYKQAQDQMKMMAENLVKYSQEQTQSAVKPLLEKDSKAQKTGMWSDAINQLSSDPAMEGFKDFADPKPGQESTPFQEFLQSADGKPYLSMVHAINKNPQAASKFGWTPETVLRMAYNQFYTPNRIKSEREKAQREVEEKFKSVREVPGSRTNITSAEGKDWDEIEQEDGDPFKYLYA